MMMNEALPIIIAFLLSVCFGFVFIPGILNFCKEKNIYDIPNQRKVHKTLVPRLGGLAFVPAITLSIIVAVGVMSVGFTEPKIQVSLWSMAFLASLLLVYATGVVDDLIGLNAHVKFAVQVITACALPLCGLYVNNLYGFMGIHEVPYWLGFPLTVFIIVFIDNAMNLIDGIDGLAAGLSILALLGFLFVFGNAQLIPYAVIVASAIGILIPYMRFNIWGKAEQNRKIFMGDSGSLTLGFILGFLFVKSAMHNPPLMAASPERFVLAYSLLVVPVFDVVRVVLHRLRTRRPLFSADKNHIHHKLMRLGMTQHQALIFILALAIAYVTINLLLFPLVSITGIVLIDVATFTLFQLLLTRKVERKELKIAA